jgi:hypothetical protein
MDGSKKLKALQEQLNKEIELVNDSISMYGSEVCSSTLFKPVVDLENKIRKLDKYVG